MSDDFAICNNCGAYNEGATNPEESLSMNEHNLEKFKEALDRAEDRAQGLLTGEVFELRQRVQETQERVDFLQEKLDNNEALCSRCGQWSTFSWEHVEYHKEDF